MLGLRLSLPQDRPLRLLALGAHCDDIEIGAGGTVRRLIGEHAAVDARWVVVAASDGRSDEALASAEHFLRGAASRDIDVMGYRESFLPDHWGEIKERFFDLARAFSPDLVLTHRRVDRHQDHRVVADLTWNTFRDQVVLEYEIPKYEGDLGHPNLFVPLEEEVVADKVEALVRFFPSQAARGWFDAETFRSILRLRGIECNARYAEAFHAHKLRL